MQKFIDSDNGVYTIVLPHYIVMDAFRMGTFNNVIEHGYTHLEYDKNHDYSDDFYSDATVIVTIRSIDWEVYSDYLKVAEDISIIRNKTNRVIVIAQLVEASTFNLLQAGLELLDENHKFRLNTRLLSIPNSLYNLSDAVISIDKIKWSDTEEGMNSYTKIRVLKSSVFEYGKCITQSQII